MSLRDRFRHAVLRGMKGSPFQGDATLKVGQQSVPLTGIVLDESENKREQDEYGAQAMRVLSFMLPKDQVKTRPSPPRDLVLYAGRTYTITSVEGDEAHAPAWSVVAASPLK